jgi:hypothetical protein
MISVNMEWSSAKGWTFIVPRKLTPVAFDNAKKKYFEFYGKLLEDMHPEDPARANIEASLTDLKNNRCRQVVGGMDLLKAAF